MTHKNSDESNRFFVETGFTIAVGTNVQFKTADGIWCDGKVGQLPENETSKFTIIPNGNGDEVMVDERDLCRVFSDFAYVVLGSVLTSV